MTTARTSVLIVDDHSIVLAGLRALVESSTDFEVVGDCTSAADARALAPQLVPDLAVLDLRLGDALGPELCRDVIQSSPRTKVLILTGFSDIRILRACMQEGASGILLKGAADLDLLGAMRDVIEGTIVLDPVIRQELNADEELLHGGEGRLYATLRPREYKVLRLMAQGMTTKEIGEELGLTINTVRSYAQALMQKLDAHSRVQLIVKARQMNLI
ncbi:response regulator transcription factor [Rhodococcus sp. NPDC059968]|uniref:response regulator transcription factor n=1 Tax=Rhodococcus sp. NPDC059968 TaxID=3347017 RepID=UPI00366FD853